MKVICVSMDEKLLKDLDDRRGLAKRSTFICKVLEIGFERLPIRKI